MSVCSLYISRTVHPICFIPTAMPALLMPNKVLANLRFSVNFSINPLQSLLSVQHFECAVLKKAACSVTRGQEIQQTQAPHWYNIKRKWTKWVTPWKTMWNMLRIWNVHTIIDKNPVKMLWRDRSFKSRRGPHVSVDLAGSHQENTWLFFVHLPAFGNSSLFFIIGLFAVDLCNNGTAKASWKIDVDHNLTGTEPSIQPIGSWAVLPSPAECGPSSWRRWETCKLLLDVSAVSVEKTSLPWEFWPASVTQAINNLPPFFFTERRKIKLFSPEPVLTEERRCALSARYRSSNWAWNIVMLKAIDFTASCLTYFTREVEYEVKADCGCLFFVFFLSEGT